MTKKTTWFLILSVLLMGAALPVLGGDTLLSPPPVPETTAPADAPEGLPDIRIFLPAVFGPAETLPWVNTQDIEAVRLFYLDVYLSSEGVAHGWTGKHSTCNPGATSTAFKDAILRRINYFRQMSGIPPLIGLNADYNSKAQAAALMMSVNARLSHSPDPSWECYSAAGDEAAGSSNLYLGVYGPAAISGYIYDPGSGNYPVGHRRWILHPKTQYMGTGDIPPVNGERSSNALWVFDSSTWGDRPDTRDGFVAWPPAGYVPRQVIYPRWSFSFPGADFSATTVSVKRNNNPVGVTVSPVVNGYGENTIVWELAESLPAGNTTYQVTLQNVKINGNPQNFSYEVMVFDPTQ